MKSILLPLLSLLLVCTIVYAQDTEVDWRFGFEYIEVEPPFATEGQHDTLQSRLAFITASQQMRGGINTNRIGGGWLGMQASPEAEIDFRKTDAWVQRFQRNGFELVWNLVPNADWSFANNPDCVGEGLAGSRECAPDMEHEQAWFNYVKAVVERYDGDGIDDMEGLQIPIRFYNMQQEIYFSGQGGGDEDEKNGIGFWKDNVDNLVRLHMITYNAMREADPTGTVKLIGSGGWFIDLYSDFPDYPELHGPTVQARLEGDNLFNSTYTKGFDSLVVLVQRLGDDSNGKKCDYIGWHPHSGWKATDQSMKFIRTYAPEKPNTSSRWR